MKLLLLPKRIAPISLISFFLIAFLCFYNPAKLFAQDSNYLPGELLIQLRGNHTFEELKKEIPEISVREVLAEEWNLYWAVFDNSLINEYSLLERVKSHPFVSVAQFNHIVEQRATPNDPNYGTMWGLHNTGQSGGTIDADIDAPEAWDITTGGLTALGDSIVVAVIDGGFQLTHTDINFWKNYGEIPGNGIDDDLNGYIDDVNGWNAYSNNGDMSYVDSHGTHVSGTVGAKGNNGALVTGVNWNVKVMAIRGSSGTETVVLRAYRYVYNLRKLYNQTNGLKGAYIVSTNASFGIDNADPANYPLWCGIYDTLGSVGVLSAGATANANYNIDVTGDMPTACPSNYLITVTNSTRTDAKASSAGYGLTTIDLGAPGSSIISTYPTNTTGTISGTSMATPHVAGSVGLMYAAGCVQLIQDYKNYPDSVAKLMKAFMLDNVDAKPAFANNTVSGGRLNLHQALLAIQAHCSIITSGTRDHSLVENKFQINSLYPNPANKWVNIEYLLPESRDITIIVTDILGKEAKTISHKYGHGGVNSHKINLNELTAGVYFISLNLNGVKSNTMKVVVY